MLLLHRNLVECRMHPNNMAQQTVTGPTSKRDRRILAVEPAYASVKIQIAPFGDNEGSSDSSLGTDREVL